MNFLNSLLFQLNVSLRKHNDQDGDEDCGPMSIINTKKFKTCILIFKCQYGISVYVPQMREYVQITTIVTIKSPYVWPKFLSRMLKDAFNVVLWI